MLLYCLKYIKMNAIIKMIKKEFKNFELFLGKFTRIDEICRNFDGF